ncbi:hypothetical protein [Oceanobacillus sp. CFH 90083]|uniref:YkvI family membrane protein n=1 Tax=Oceanobacillus sp. CFH 90083 TaxID=2592336 RepID=UPI00128D7636|nr:hypothetical protein [Oceanobacillus sp. CFH 90083]
MWRRGLQWMALILGATIGAGYVSGRELWQFFGHESGLAIVIFAFLFSFCCYVIMAISYQMKSVNYLPVLEIIAGKKLTKVFDGLILLYLFTTTMIMIAGSGAAGQVFHLPYSVGIAITGILLVLLFLKGIKGLLTVNEFILPVLITGLLYVLALYVSNENLQLFAYWHEQRNWFAAFPFTALNILPLVAILGAIGSKVKGRGEMLVCCIGTGLCLGTVSYIYNSSLIQIADEIMLYEIPLFAILKEFPLAMILFMSTLLWLAIFTTAAAGMLGIATRVQSFLKEEKPMYLIVFISVLLMLPLTGFGFANLINFLYPLYGVLNLYILARLLTYPLWSRIK